MSYSSGYCGRTRRTSADYLSHEGDPRRYVPRTAPDHIEQGYTMPSGSYTAPSTSGMRTEYRGSNHYPHSPSEDITSDQEELTVEELTEAETAELEYAVKWYKFLRLPAPDGAQRPLSQRSRLKEDRTLDVKVNGKDDTLSMKIRIPKQTFLLY